MNLSRGWMALGCLAATAIWADDPAPASVAQKTVIDQVLESQPALKDQLGEPIEAEAQTADGLGTLRVFRSGAMYVHPAIGQVALRGELWKKYDSMRRESGPLGLPTMGNVMTTDYVGEHAYFQKGVMYWSRGTGAHWIGDGPLLYKYVDLGRQRGFLGWPIRDPQEKEGRVRIEFERGTLTWSEKEGVTVPKTEFLIVAPKEFEAALRPLVEHKNRTGMGTRLVTLEYLGERYQNVSRDLPEALKRALYDHRRLFETKYVLLVGDITRMPTRYCLMSEEESFSPGSYDYSMYGYTPTDLYYACLLKSDGSFDTWDPNLNNQYGEIHSERTNYDMINLHPTLGLGRLVASTAKQVETYVQKVIRYETTAWGRDFTKRAIVAGMDWGVDQAQVMAGYLGGFELTKFYDRTPAGETGVQPLNEEKMTEVINQGVLFAAYSGHGHDAGWHGTWNAKAALPRLKNADCLPVICSSACLTQVWNWGTPLNADGTRCPPSAAPIAHWAEPPLVPSAMQPPPSVATWSPIPAPVTESMATFMLMENENGAIVEFGFSNVAQGGFCDRLIQGVLKRHSEGGRVAGDLWMASLAAYADDRQLFDQKGAVVVVGFWSRRAAMVQPYKFVLMGDPSLRIGGVPADKRNE